MCARMQVRVYTCTRAPRATPSRGYSRQLAFAARVSTYVPLPLPLSSYRTPLPSPQPPFLFHPLSTRNRCLSLFLHLVAYSCARARACVYVCVSASISFHSCAFVMHGHRRIRAGFARGVKCAVAVGRRGGLHGRRVMIFRAHYEIFEMICRDCAF